MHEAMLYDRLDDGKVKCRLCAHGCVIKDKATGICQVRENRGGVLYSLVYGKPIAGNLDPIEKKPLFHYLPGTLSYSIATVGCNFQCGFCQNWDISQYPRDRGGIPGGGPGGQDVPPEKIVAAARAGGAASISYTYTEPTIYFEYAFDCMKLAQDAGLGNVFVSNGYESADCVAAMQGLLSAANIDLKAMNGEFYKANCKARLQPVLDTLIAMRRAGVWLEVTTLLIPGQNDDPAELKELTRFIADELGSQTPWHVSAYRPEYKYSQSGPPPTPVASLERALIIGNDSGLKHVYAGNAPGHDSESTRCPACKEVVVNRRHYTVRRNALDSEGLCPHCGEQVPGVWS